MEHKLKTFCIGALLMLLQVNETLAESGYELWLRYHLIEDVALKRYYQIKNSSIVFTARTQKQLVAKTELYNGLKGLLDFTIQETHDVKDNCLLVGNVESSPLIASLLGAKELDSLGDEGYIIRSLQIKQKKVTVVAAQKDQGLLYAIFHYLKLIQTHQSLDEVSVKEVPKIIYRVLNHWDNLDGTIERGYAGYSLWDWERLPYYRSQRCVDYARANASIGINGIVLNNVNANAKSLRTEWLIKAAGLADSFRPYGIRVFLTARFSAPQEIGNLDTSDTMNPKVKQWWKNKVAEIYEYIPDFGGFLIKANSEGQPGPQDYGRTHAEGANMIAEALQPYGGILFWRAFVYKNERHVDRVVTGYNEFKPLDGQFKENVFLQTKNGAIDFQPREPFHPLFGKMPNTALSLEFQITQENLGHAGHLVYLAPLFEETLQSDVYGDGKGNTVSKILQNCHETCGMSAIAGVSNVGTDLNWTGYLFGQANWHAFGRLAWNPDLTSEKVSEEWVRMTFSNREDVVDSIKRMMLISREAAVNYMMPLGLNHIMNFHTHNGPEPWHDDPLWTAYDYHQVTKDSIGVDRTGKGSKATGQYHKLVGAYFENLETCPDRYLLWFHRLPWEYKMKSGQTLWNELVDHYYKGVEEVRTMQSIWTSLKDVIDDERFTSTEDLLQNQEREAVWWRDACLLFFKEYSQMPIPEVYESPRYSLDYYKKIPFPYDWDKTQMFK